MNAPAVITERPAEGVGLIRSILPAAEIVEQMVVQAASVIRRLGTALE